ncbi:MAG TPA: YncE family protein [Blastocatellia bacterium]|nr:YncE family protein [Blastocatellia bacterium]
MRRITILLCLITTVCLTAAGQTPKILSGGAASKSRQAFSQGFEKEGITVDFSIESLPASNGENPGLVAGADAIVSFRVTDKRTGQPLTGLRPRAWIDSRKVAHAPNEAECKDRIRTFMGGLLSVRPDIDLNSYSLVTLNHDKTITFINPQVSFNVTKLENIIMLPSTGADWALSNDKEVLYVTLPESSAVAMINAVTRRLINTVQLESNARPTRVSLQPDGRYVWVGLDGSPQVAVIEAKTGKLKAMVEVGGGLHCIAFAQDGQSAYVTNSVSDSVTVIDTTTLARVGDIAVGRTPAPIAASSASGFVYAASINAGEISVINPAANKVVKTIRVGRGVVAMKFDQTGRYLFAVNQVESTVTAIDVSTNDVIASGQVVNGPDQIAFTSRYAYVRGTESEKFSLIDLNEIIHKRSLTTVNIQAGRQAPSALPQEIGVADMIQPTPEGNSVIIANAPDMMLYYYAEGLMAPMGTFQNYKRRPRALMIIDRSLGESARGIYSTPVKLTGAGRFDVPLLIDQPRIANCFSLEIAKAPGGELEKPRLSLTIEPLFKGKQFKAGEVVGLRFKLTDSVTSQPLTGLRDVQVLAFEPPGVWQQRQWARDLGDGLYEVMQTFPRAGLYNILLRVGSRGARFADLPNTRLTIVE